MSSFATLFFVILHFSIGITWQMITTRSVIKAADDVTCIWKYDVKNLLFKMKFSYIYQYAPPFHFFAPHLSVLPRCHFYVVPRPMFRASGSVKHLLTRAFLHQTSWEELKSSSCSAKRQLVGRCFSWRKLAEDPSTLVSSAQLLAVAICFFGNTDFWSTRILY